MLAGFNKERFMSNVAIRREVMDLLKALLKAHQTGTAWSQIPGIVFEKDVVDWGVSYRLIEPNTVDGEETVYRLTADGKTAIVTGETPGKGFVECSPQYPNWQSAIREAQVTQAEIEADIDRMEAERQMAKEAKEGQRLARVLDVAFGIKVDPPSKNDVILDGVRFWLADGSYNEWTMPVKSSTLPPDEPYTHLISFGLYVSPVKPADTDIDVEDWPIEYVGVQGKATARPQTETLVSMNEEWCEVRAELATKLDLLPAAAKRTLEQYAAYKLTQSIKSQKKSQITIEGLIKSLVDKAVKDALEERLAGEF